MMYDFLIVGGGVFGITSAIALVKKNFKVGLINPDTIPHHLAASSDISKAVRMEYGSDEEYFKMAELSIERWKAWNDLLGEKLYHEVGILMLCKHALESDAQSFEKHSFQNLKKNGYSTNRLDASSIHQKFPAIKSHTYTDANYNPIGGYVESGFAIEKLSDYARSLGVEIHEGQTAEKLIIEKNSLQAIQTKEGKVFQCGHAIIAAGAHTPYLIPESMPYFKTTGHPLFWIKPSNPKNFTPPLLSVFMADISNSGWYGFPFHTKHGVVKIGKHSEGLPIHPDKDDRQIKNEEIIELRHFLKSTFPELFDAPVVYSRRCIYTDTLDGHFWIDQHPEIKGLTISTGGSGHGMKMGPVLGEMTAAVALGQSHQFSNRYGWRHLTSETKQLEEARNFTDKKV